MANDSARTIFLQALERHAPETRDEFVERACAGDRALRGRVDALLEAHVELGDLHQQSDPGATTAVPGRIEQAGTQLGPYTLREKIGEGGFGVVYVAEQQRPVRRKVALKIVKPGMDTKEVIARFEAERQALALMDHPNIAKVLDAGTTGGNPKSEARNAKQIRSTKRESQNRAADGVADVRDSDFDSPSDFGFRDSNSREAAGRPYFVMELVQGVSITEFCDERQLGTRERLRLFVDVCRAVHHAHQKGVIHRDLKPSNVMVTLHDGKPVVKVIDFGVAKALGRTLSDNSVYTAYDQMIGTPLYMSPEQAQRNGLDVDTRSDVYSLGVLLYELLTGTTPFDSRILKKAGFDEMRRIIREDEPPRPSARVSTLNAQALSTVAGRRKIDGRKLSRALRGELDWIAMKALEKDRNRRYESASAFAADVERYLNHEPILARPAGPLQKVRKWMRRHPVLVRSAAGMSLVAFIASLTGSWLIWREKQQLEIEKGRVETARRKEADARRKADEQRRKVEENLRLADEFLVRFVIRPTKNSLLRDPKREKQYLAMLREALKFYDRFAETNAGMQSAHLVAGRAYLRAGGIRYELGHYERGIESLEKCIALLQKAEPDEGCRLCARKLMGSAYNMLGLIHHQDLDYAGAERAYRRAAAIQQKLVVDARGDSSIRQNVAAVGANLANVLRVLGRFDEAERMLTESVATLQDLIDRHPQSAEFKDDQGHALTDLAILHRERGDLKAALGLHRRAVEFRRKARSADLDDHQVALNLCYSYARMIETLNEMRMYAEALETARELLSVAEKVQRDVPAAPAARQQLAGAHFFISEALIHLHRKDEAQEPQQRALRLLESLVGDFAQRPRYQYQLAELLTRRADLLDKSGRLQDAEEAYRKAQHQWKALSKRAPDVASFREQAAESSRDLGYLLSKVRRIDDAEKQFAVAIREYQSLADDFPQNRRHRWNLSVCYSRLAGARLENERYEKAQAAIQKALPVQRQFVKDDPQNNDYKRELAHSLYALGHQLTKTKRYKEALPLIQESCDLRKQLLDAEPHSLNARYELGGIYEKLAITHKLLGNMKQALDAAGKGEAILTKLIAESDVPEYRYVLSMLLNNRGFWHLEQNRLDDARRDLEAAMRHMRAALKPFPDNPRYKLALANHCFNLANVQIKQGEHAAAAKILVEFAAVDWMAAAQAGEFFIRCAENVKKDRNLAPALRERFALQYASRAVKTVDDAVNRCPKTRNDQLSLLNKIHPTAKRLKKMRYRPQAVAVYRHCIAIVETYGVAEGPKSREYAVWLGEEYTRFAELLDGLGKWQEAIVTLKRAIVHWDALISKDQPKLKHLKWLASALNDVGFLEHRHGRAVEARDHLIRGVECGKEVLARDDKDPKARNNLCLAYGNLTMAYILLGDHAAAAKTAILHPRSNPTFFNCRSGAYFLVRCSRVADKDPALTAEQRAAAVKDYVDKAHALLRQAADALPDDAASRHAFARFLLTFSDRRMHVPDLAVRLAEQAVARVSAKGKSPYLSTLGLALCRAGQFDSAVKTLEHSRKLAGGHSVGEWYINILLALAHAGSGHRERSERCLRAADAAYCRIDARTRTRSAPFLAEVRSLRREVTDVLQQMNARPVTARKPNG